MIVLDAILVAEFSVFTGVVIVVAAVIVVFIVNDVDVVNIPAVAGSSYS